MLDEYKELCRSSANLIPDWMSLSKNDLCRAYVANKGNDAIQNAYLSAILYRYWNLISKYYYMSANCATPEECYGWLVDSVCCCVNLASWENPDSSIYKDPNGPDKVINRCMKCARLTYYQFINRKKRKDDFGMLSIEELTENYGNNGAVEVIDSEQDYKLSDVLIKDYIIKEFKQKNYFVSFLLYCIISVDVFDLVSTKEHNGKFAQLNMRKLTKVMNSITDEQLCHFSEETSLSLNDVRKAFEYVKAIPTSNMKKKITHAFEELKHSSLILSLTSRSL